MKIYLSVALISLFILAVQSSEAQDTKSNARSIIINNGDTLVNGKKFRELDRDEQARLKKEFRELEHSFRAPHRSFNRHRKSDDVTAENGILFWDDDPEEDFRFRFRNRVPDDLHIFKFDGDTSLVYNFDPDSLIKDLDFRISGLDSNMRKRIITMHRDFSERAPGISRRIEFPPAEPGIYSFPRLREKNTSSSSYSYTDKDGVSSRMNIRISDAGNEQTGKITGSENASQSLEVNDLTLFPNFSSGKISLSFNLSGKGNTKVTVLDSDLKQIFKDETAGFSGNYIKQISLPKNGVYYIAVSQNGNWFIRKLVKE